MYNAARLVNISNSVFWNNNASNDGGAIYNGGYQTAITNCTFNSNIAVARGGAMGNFNYSHPMLTNCIFWGDSAATGPEICTATLPTVYGYAAVPSFSHCDVQGCKPGGIWDSGFGQNAGGNIDQAPILFTDVPPHPPSPICEQAGPNGLWGDYDDGLQLATGSPCIDAGDNDLPLNGIDIGYDYGKLLSLPRIIHTECNPSIDIGAYEYAPYPTLPAVGPYHSLQRKPYAAEYTCAQGYLYAAGSNMNGFLGVGPDYQYTPAIGSVPVHKGEQNCPGPGFASPVSWSCGSVFSLAVDECGGVYGWGWNNEGQIGNGTIDEWYLDGVFLPARVKKFADGSWLSAAKVAAGYEFSLALSNEFSGGVVWAWGDNYNKQLGNPTIYPGYDDVPAAVPVLKQDMTQLSGIVKITAGTNHALALANTNMVWSWGYPSSLRGDDCSGIRNYADTVKTDGCGSSPLTDITDIAASTNYSFALKSNGDVYAWGNGSLPSVLGRLDIPTNVWVPQQVQAGEQNPDHPDYPLHDVTSIAAGYNHAIALVGGNGYVYAWGDNYYGQLGWDYYNSSSNRPVRVVFANGVTPLTCVIGVSAGANSSLALDKFRHVWCWGDNTCDQLAITITSNCSTFPAKLYNPIFYGENEDCD